MHELRPPKGRSLDRIARIRIGPRGIFTAHPAIILLLTVSCLWGCDEPEPKASEGPSLHGVGDFDGEQTSLLCGANLFVALVGKGLVFVGEEKPTLELTDADGQTVAGEVMELSVQPECSPIEGFEGAVRCEQVYARLPLEPANELYVSELTLTNPDLEGLGGSAKLELTIAPDPTITAVSPDVIWIPEGGREITVKGNGFMAIDEGDGEVLPEVFMQNSTRTRSTLEIVDITDCSPLDLTDPGVSTARICSTIIVRLGRAGQDITNLQDGGSFGVRNPAPLGCETQSTHGVGLFPDPDHDTMLLEPPFVCGVGSGRSVRLSGPPMYRVDGQGPTVTVDGIVAQASLDRCEREDEIQSCSETTITLPPELEASGAVDVVFTHPPPLDHPLTASLFIESSLLLERATPDQVSASAGPQPVILTTTGWFAFNGDPTVTMVNSAGETVMLDVDVPTETNEGQPNCEVLTTEVPDGVRCLELEVTIPPETLTESYTPTLTVDQIVLGGCSTTSSSILTISP